MKISIDLIRTDGGTQSRLVIDMQIVVEYAEAMKRGDTFPPLDVYYDGTHYWLVDGFHRLGAYEENKAGEVECNIKQGTRRDAVLASVGVNGKHGLRRTNEDKRNAVMTLLNDEEWGKWSAREIARKCVVSHTFVDKIRSTGNVASTVKYANQFGDITTMNTTNIGTPEAVQAVVDTYGVKEPETIKILKRLYKSQNSPTSNGTFEEIARTGYIQPTGEDDAVHITKDPRWLNLALEKKASLHRQTAAQAKYARDIIWEDRRILAKAKEIRQEQSRVRNAERIERLEEISKANTDLNGVGLFPVIYADPPWRYEHSKTPNRDIENHYPTMSLDDICNMELSKVSTDDCILFLWATSPKLAESMTVIDSWGFTYRTSMVWDKEVIGMGYYARQQHELLLICTKGSIPVPLPENRPSSVYSEKRGVHSRKPEYFYHMIEKMYPTLPKLELFARSPREGWDVWGNQSD